MARLLSVEECDVSLRNMLIKTLRCQDAATLLPNASWREDSGTFKNITFVLNGTHGNVPTSIFSENWFHGVSAVLLDARDVERISNMKREDIMKALKEIPSQTTSDEIVVGPPLDSNESDCDVLPWTAGFDTPSCFCGIFMAHHSAPPMPHLIGQTRMVKRAWLVVKAGAGEAGSTFHSRFVSSLHKNDKSATLKGVLESNDLLTIGASHLRRLTRAGTRNRCRILADTMKRLNTIHTTTTPDALSNGMYRLAVVDIDVNTNTITKDTDSNTYTYCTGVDARFSLGCLTLSNLSEGLVVFLDKDNETQPIIKNQLLNCIPFSTKRISTEREMVTTIVKAHREAMRSGRDAHPDKEFVKNHFIW